MFDILLSVLTGGATGILGSILGKLFSFADAWIAEKKATADHERTKDMHRLQAELRSKELENELTIVEAQVSGELRTASYAHDRSIAIGYPWVGAVLRMVRPILTVGLIILVWYIYYTTLDLGLQAEITASSIYMCSTAVLWWFGDRAMRKK